MYNAYGSLSQSQTEGEAPIVSSYTVNGMPLGSYEGNISTGIGYIYDKYGNIKREAELGSQIYKDYTYDVNGNRKSFTLKKGTETLSTVEYSYDNLDRITEVDFGESVGKVTYSYDANGRLLTETRGGITTSYSYNKAGLAVSMSSSEGSSYTYAYQLDGNMTQKMDSINGETTYEYNRLGQLTGETREKEGEGTQEAIYYIYDSRGNRIQKTDVFKKKLVRYSYDEGNQLKKEKEEPLPGAPCENPYEMETQYEYDGNGNVIFKWKGIEKEAGAGEEELKLTAAGGKEGVETEEDYAYIYHYDNRNRMTGMESESVKARYSYDPMGRRKSKTVNGVTTGHIWDKDNIVYETKGDGSKLASYYRGIHLAAIDNGAIDYYLYDNHGDITGMKNEGSSIIYDAFGNQTSDTTGGYNPFRYNSQYTDAESGLIYLRARYYDPSIGRFMAEDPVKDGLNWYAYCAGNPVMKVDPSGLDDYIFYSLDQEKAAKQYKEDMRKKDPNKEVHLIYVGTEKDFEQGWNEMGTVNGKNVTIDTVIINIHGDEKEIWGTNGKSIDLKSLERKKIDEIILLSCNTGNIEYVGTNPASKLASLQDVNYVIAPDGYNARRIDNHAMRSVLISPVGNPPHTKTNRNKGKGYSIYLDVDGYSYVITGLSEDDEEFLSITDLLDEIHKLQKGLHRVTEILENKLVES